MGKAAIIFAGMVICYQGVALCQFATTITVDWAIDEEPNNSNHTCTFVDGAFFFPDTTGSGAGRCTLRRAVREAGARPPGDRPILIQFTSLDGTNADGDDAQYDVDTGQWVLPIDSSTAQDHWRLEPRSILDVTGDVTIEGLPLTTGFPFVAPGLPTIFIDTERTLEIELTGNTIRRIGMYGGGGYHFKEAGNTLENGTWGLAKDGQTIEFADLAGDPNDLAGPHGVLVLMKGDDSTIRNNAIAGAATKAIEVNSGTTGAEIIGNFIGTRADGTVPAVPVNVQCETFADPFNTPPNPQDWYGGWGISVAGTGAMIQVNVIAGLQNIRATNDTPPGALQVLGLDHTVDSNTIGRDAQGGTVGVCGQAIQFSGEDHTITDNLIDRSRNGFENTGGAILWSDVTIPGNITGGTLLQGNLLFDGPDKYFEMGPMIHDQTRFFEPGEIDSIVGTVISGGAASGWPCASCTIDFYTDDLDGAEEAFEWLGSTVANGAGDFTFNAPHAIAGGLGVRTTTTSAADEQIPNSLAGTTSEISALPFFDPTIFADGFESGDTSAWSSSQ